VVTEVRFVIDPTDGTGADDACNWDYKNATVTVSWNDAYPGSITMSTIVAPKSRAEEAQTCLAQPGGVLNVNVFDASGNMVPMPTINIYSPDGTTLIATAAPASGTFSFALPAGTYRVVTMKDGYSTARSYGTDEVATPDTLNPTIIVNDSVPLSLSIDKVSIVTIDAIAPTGADNLVIRLTTIQKLRNKIIYRLFPAQSLLPVRHT